MKLGCLLQLPDWYCPAVQQVDGRRMNEPASYANKDTI
jgi:hypothetical protein